MKAMLFLVSLFLHAQFAVGMAPSNQPVLTWEEARAIELVNEERMRQHLLPLEVDSTLVVTARQHSREMMTKGYFGHISPTVGLTTPLDRYLSAIGSSRRSYDGYLCIGENCFYCSIPDVDRGQRAFMASSTHRANVIYPDYERIGAGVAIDRSGQMWLTVMFVTDD